MKRKPIIPVVIALLLILAGLSFMLTISGHLYTGAGLIALRAQQRERVLVVIAARAIPLQHHQRAGHADHRCDGDVDDAPLEIHCG